MFTNTFITLSTATANVGVLVGLVFLIFELRQTSTIALSQMTQQRALSYIDQNVAYAPDQEFSELMARVYKQHDFDSVTKNEWFQIARHESIERTRARDIWFQYNKGLIDDGIYLLYINSAANRLPLWEWLEVFVPEDFKADAIVRSEEKDFQAGAIRTKFIEWSKDNKSPYEI